MAAHPEFVAGTGRLCTDLMKVSRSRVFAKVGAEGYYCAGAPALRLGVALKIEDGAKRAAEPALLAVLHALDLLSANELSALAPYATPAVLNTRGEAVGEIVATHRAPRPDRIVPQEKRDAPAGHEHTVRLSGYPNMKSA